MDFFALLNAINAVMLSVPTLLFLLGVGVLFTFWSGFSQYRSLTHGVGLISGKWASKDGPGVISHFQALSAALSATVGLGNIAGVAIAVELGGPGAVFWMWMVGLAGMAVKSFEVMLSMLYRNTDDPENPHGGLMWVAKHGLKERFPRIGRLGTYIGGLFAIPLILFAITGGNMFQAWSVADTTRAYFGVPTWLTGSILAVVVGLVILGGIRRIGLIAGTLVPAMCGVYILCGIFVLISNASALPDVFRLIFVSAFAPAEASGAFIGGAFGSAFIFGMKRALFSSEAGLGSAPIAHSAVRTKEPASEAVVAGLEPFIDTLVVCTITALVILSSGIWQRGPSGNWAEAPEFGLVAGGWTPRTIELPQDGQFNEGDTVFIVVEAGTHERTGQNRHRLFGSVIVDNAAPRINWRPLPAEDMPRAIDAGLYHDYPASTLTAKAFDTAADGLGQWMVTLAVWLFAISTIITWSYYGEQGVIYLLGERAVTPYRAVWCALIIVPTLGFIRTAAEIDTLSTVALGFMMLVNLPILLLLGSKGIAAYKDYIRRLDSGEITSI